MNEERRWLSRARNVRPDQSRDRRGASLERMLLVSGAVGLLAPRAFGYAEDICYAPACGQVAHILLHEGETGEPSGVVPPRTVQGLEWMLRETFAWAASRGYTPMDQGRAAARAGADDLDLLVEQLVARLASAEAEPCASRRLKRLCEIGKASGVPWMYSNPDCVFPSFPGDQRCSDEAPAAAP